jgi:hypothetical protein
VSSTGAAVVVATLVLASAAASAQKAEDIPGFEPQDVPSFRVETKITPKRAALLPWISYGDDFEFKYIFDGAMPDFSSLIVGCKLFIAGDQNPPTTMLEGVRRSDFKPIADGKFVATRGPTYIPRGGHTSPNCSIRKIVK